MIDEGCALVLVALPADRPARTACRPPSPPCTTRPPTSTSTDWPQVVALYDVLLAITPSPVVALNRAAAVAMRDGPAAGLALLDELAEEPRLRDYHPYAVARADLLARLGRYAEAARRTGGRSRWPAPTRSAPTCTPGCRPCTDPALLRLSRYATGAESLSSTNL